MVYFIIENGQQSGPFTIDQLAQKQITSETLVWAEGMSTWTPAWKVEDLRNLLSGHYTQTPPPYTPGSQTSSSPADGVNPGSSADGLPPKYEGNATPAKKKNRTPLFIVLGVLLIVFLFLAFTNPGKEDHETVIKNEVSAAVEKASQNSTSEDPITQGFNLFAKMITGTFMDSALDELLQYHNYILFSKTSVALNGRDHTVSYGFLGKVYTANEDDILKALGRLNPMGIEAEKDETGTPSSDAAETQSSTNPTDEDAKLDEKASQMATHISDQVQQKVEEKIDKKIDQLSDSTTIDRIINKILSLF